MKNSYVELPAHSAFSFLDGASTPVELATTAACLGYSALALTDHDGVWGSIGVHARLLRRGLRPITGAEVSVDDAEGAAADGPGHLTLLVETTSGYRNLCQLLTAAHAHTPRGRPALGNAAIRSSSGTRTPVQTRAF